MEKKVINHSKSTVSSEEKKLLCAVIDSNFLSEGEYVYDFEKKLAKYIGCQYAVATSSGSLALQLSLLALNIKEGDEVIIPNYTCRSVLNAVEYLRAKPVLCDVDRKTFNIHPDEIKKNITKKTKAIIVAHMFGCPAQIGRIKSFGIPIIEDCAQSIGSEYFNKRVGSLGDISIFSFEGTKTITTGEGGMVLTNSQKLFKRLKSLKDPYSKNEIPKYTYRMSNLQAAVGIAQLKKLPAFIKKRRFIAKKYLQSLDFPNIILPIIPAGIKHTFHRFIVGFDKSTNAKFIEKCQKKKILIKRPIKPYVLSDYLKMPAKKFPNTQYIMKYCVSLPIYPLLNNREIQKVINVVKDQYVDK